MNKELATFDFHKLLQNKPIPALDKLIQEGYTSFSIKRKGTYGLATSPVRDFNIARYNAKNGITYFIHRIK